MATSITQKPIGKPKSLEDDKKKSPLQSDMVGNSTPPPPIIEKIGTATRIGDSLYGAKTGITPENASSFDKAKSYLSSSGMKDYIKDNNLGISSKPDEMVEVAPGVKMSRGTADSYNTANKTIAAQQARDKEVLEASRKKVQESINKRIAEKKKREEESGEKYRAFVAKIADRKAKETSLKGMEEEMRDREKVASKNYRNLRKKILRGRYVDPDELARASEQYAYARRALGYTNDWDYRERKQIVLDAYENRKKDKAAKQAQSEESPDAPASTGIAYDSDYKNPWTPRPRQKVKVVG